MILYKISLFLVRGLLGGSDWEQVSFQNETFGGGEGRRGSGLMSQFHSLHIFISQSIISLRPLPSVMSFCEGQPMDEPGNKAGEDEGERKKEL